MRVMIVDDEAPARSELRYLLEETGRIDGIMEASSAREAVERLMAAAQKVGEKLNKAAAAQAQPQAGQAAGAAGGEAPKGGNDDDVVDADFKEVKH